MAEFFSLPEIEQTVDLFMEQIKQWIGPQATENVTVAVFVGIQHDLAPPVLYSRSGKLVKLAKNAWDTQIASDTLKLELQRPDLSTAEIERTIRSLTPYQYDVPLQRYRLGDTEIPGVVDDLVKPSEEARAILNYVTGRDVSALSGLPRARPLSLILPSPLYVITNKNDITDQFFYDPKSLAFTMSPLPPLDSTETERYEALTSQLSAFEATQTCQMAWNLLLLHQKALDSIEPEVSFFHSWQILENIASPTQRGRGIDAKTIMRHLTLLQPLSTVEVKVLERLGNLRNRFAHTGIFPEHEASYEYSDTAREYAVRYLDIWLSDVMQRFTTVAEVEAYYGYRNASDRQLEAVRDAINKIQLEREAVTGRSRSCGGA